MQCENLSDFNENVYDTMGTGPETANSGFASKRNQILKVKRAIKREFRDINEIMHLLVKAYTQLYKNLFDLKDIIGIDGMLRYFDNDMPYGLTVIRHVKELLNALTPLEDETGKLRTIVPCIRVIDHNLYLQLTHDGIEPIKASPFPGFVPPSITEDTCFGFLPGGSNTVKRHFATVRGIARCLYEAQARPFDANDEEFQKIVAELWEAVMGMAVCIDEHNNHTIRTLNEQLTKAKQANKRLSTRLKNKGEITFW